MGAPPLSCTVRGCGQALERLAGAFLCSRGHAYDVARPGYVNLLQPQDRRSHRPGDTPVVLTARIGVLEGPGKEILEGVRRRVDDVPLAADAVVAELGSGSGDLLGSVAASRPIVGVGIDVSSAAAAVAARRFPGVTWVVANADRRLPLLDGSVAMVLSLHARRSPAECARVLAPGGALLVGVPATDDLIELREAVQGRRVERERASTVEAEHVDVFAPVGRTTIRVRTTVDRDGLRQLLASTYRGGRRAEQARIDELDRLEVTLATDLVLFERRD